MSSARIPGYAAWLLLAVTLSMKSFADDMNYRNCVSQCHQVEKMCKLDCEHDDQVQFAECFDICESKGEACVFTQCRRQK